MIDENGWVTVKWLSILTHIKWLPVSNVIIAKRKTGYVSTEDSGKTQRPSTDGELIEAGEWSEWGYDSQPSAPATQESFDQITWSDENADPLQDLRDLAECVDYDPLTDETLSIVELESIMKVLFKKVKR